ncbi:hypothetical protein ACFOY4_33605 [Actinomadura syzygii]|uniref:hypothetical protein n=1 Tax=Actinomadura syzygii TaxID=1427538 RepID=UPI0016522EEB|nr:hypothetical protein [Actinomadura syzygii]
MTALDRVLDALREAGRPVTRSGDGWRSSCPAHDGQNPTALSITPGRDGVLVHCHALKTCTPAEVVSALGLTPQDLFDQPKTSGARGLGEPVATYDYVDENGELLFQVCRFVPKTFRQRRPAGPGRWTWRVKGVRQVLYRLPEVRRAVADGRPVYVVEGEKDAHAVEAAGAVATCNAGGAGKWRGGHADTLTGAHVVIVADNDAPGMAHARQVKASLDGRAASVRVVRAASGKDAADHLGAGHGLAEFASVDLDESGAEPSSEVLGDEPGDKGRGPSQASILVRIARERFELFMSDDGRPYAVRQDGANLALPLRGRAGLRSLLAKVYADEQGGAVPSQSALADAMTVLEGVAQADEPRVPQLRVARHDGRIVVDLGTADGRCVIVGPDGWSRESRSPVLFRRSGAMKPLPDPVRDGDGLASLAELLNMNATGFRLLVAWLVAAFIPDLPHPILTFRGEQGTGKSKSAQMVIGIIDPSGAPKRTAPRDVKSWATQAFNNWALCLDNVSYIPDWLSDALCRAVTGDGIVDRALYTDDDVVVLEFRRVLALTTIDAGALAGDLAERLLTIELSLIRDADRREEADLDRAYADAHAAILASLFDLLAEVLKALPDVVLTERPRMADFARVLAAVDRVRGWSTLEDYKAGARDAVADVLEGEPFAQAVVKLVDGAGPDGVTLTAQEVLDRVDAPDRLPKKWPKDATRAGGQLKRLAPALRAIGIEVEEKRRKQGRYYTLTATEERRNDRAAGSGIEAESQHHQRHPEGPKDGVSSENRGDASGVTPASPLPGLSGPGDAGDARGDAGQTVASPGRTHADQGRQPSDDADDADDAEKRRRSRDDPSASFIADWNARARERDRAKGDRR